MRKFITLGVSVLAAGSLALTAAPAQAVPSATTSVCDSVNGLDGLLATALGTAGLADTTLDDANSAEAATFGEATAALTGLVDSMVGYIGSVDSGVGTAAAEAAMQEALDVYSEKASAWSVANGEQFYAQNHVDLNTLTNQLLNGIADGLCIVPVS